MFNIVLFEPEIPPNTGNIIRLCVNTNANLHLIKPLGFDLDEKQVKRAGLDYHDMANITVHESYQECLTSLKGNRIFAVTTKALKYYNEPSFVVGDILVFGPETRGLPIEILTNPKNFMNIRIPMAKNNRSMNLSNSVAVILYEAWRQNSFNEGC
jgi:tRNA (cytidine/uridine-2'-O-)-methyltransferase|tara:strand:+ start:128 stop:592 length:465 start_codon:yes stop_codon:yes gene_type:complete